MKQLVGSARVQASDRRCRISSKPPLLDQMHASTLDCAMKRDKREKTGRQPEKRKPKAKELFAALSFVVLLTALVSQAQVLIGCAKTTVEGMDAHAPVVTIDIPQSVEAADTGQPGDIISTPPAKSSAAVESSPSEEDWKSNSSLR